MTVSAMLARLRSGWLSLGVVVVVAALAGCAADKPPPTPLAPLKPTIAGRQVWQFKVDRINFPLVPAVSAGRFLVVSSTGDVVALSAADGSLVWRNQVGEPIAAGIGSDGRFASLVTRGNEVVTYDNGRELWRKRVPSSVVTPPLVAGERVFVMTVDRVVHAFDALDGRRLWVLQRPGDPLTLSQAGVLGAWRNTLLAGQGPRLAGVDPLRGSVQWEAPLANPRGGNEVERLADLVGPLLRMPERVCARAFQSAVGCVDPDKGTVLWSRNNAGSNGVAGDAERVFGADASDRITAWRAATGDVVWTNEKLLYRGLSAAAVAGPVVVFGDSEGWVHFLNSATGDVQLRLPTDGSPVVSPPVLSGNTLLVVTAEGGLYAFRPN